MNSIYLNGTYVDASQAAISIFDRGFLFGDSVYEVIPTFENHILLLDLHLQRLTQSLCAIGMENPLSYSEWKNICHTLIQRNGLHRPVYIQVTRGVQPQRQHTWDKDLKPTIVAFSLNPMNLEATAHHGGAKVIVLRDIRWKQCHIKTTSLLANVLLGQEAQRQGAFEALLIDDQDRLLEGSSSNVILVRHQALYTPPLEENLLPGITRHIILPLARAHGYTVHETCLHRNDLDTADEVWLTGSIRGIVPVTCIDDRILGSGTPGPVWKHLVPHYVEAVKAAR